MTLQSPKRILLVFAYGKLDVTAMSVHTAPLGIGYIAAFLLRDGHEVKVVDLQVQPESMVYDDLNFDIIGISSSTPHFNKACELARKIRNANFRGKIILGGAHPTALPEQTLQESGADFVCVGEGEGVLCELAQGQAVEKISGLGWIKDDRYQQNPPEIIKDSLDEYPYPAFHLFDLKKYGSYNIAIVPAGTKDGIIMTSRGCPFSCDFCFKVSPNIRLRSPQSVVDEIVFQHDTYGYRKFSFVDDCFNANPERGKQICRLIIKTGLNITFTLPNGIRADLLDEELAGLMKQAGCIGANIGVEAWDDETRQKINKKLDKTKAVNAVRLLRKNGIICTAYFIMGHYHDTEKSLQRNIDAVRELGADFFQFSKFTPMPGSPIFMQLLTEGYIQEEDLSKFSIFGEAHLMNHPTLSDEQINKAIETAYRKATFRVRTILTLIHRPIIIWNALLNAKQILRLIKFW